jgi:putative transposase
MAFTNEVLDEILKDYTGDPEQFAAPCGLLKQLTKALIERAMEAELSVELGYRNGQPGDKPTTNRRNGRTTKTLRTDYAPMEVSAPKGPREWRGFDEKILSMYALGLTTHVPYKMLPTER